MIFPSRFARLRLIVPALAVLVAGGCSSVPRWQGLTTIQLWEMAQTEFQAGDYGDAIQTLDRLIQGSPGFEYAAEAQMMLGDAHFLDKKYILAQSEYTRFLDRHAGHPSAPAAALGMCRSNERLSPISQRDQTFTKQAVQICANVANDWGGTIQADSAAVIVDAMRLKLAQKQYETGAYYLRLGVPTAAILYWDEVVELYPATPWAPAALQGIINAYARLGYDDEVEAARTRLVELYPDSPEAQTGRTDRRSDGGS